MKLFVGLIIIAATLSACLMPSLPWYKEGAGQQELITDQYECERDVRQSEYFGGAKEIQGFYERCMNARGWIRGGGPVVTLSPEANKSRIKDYKKSLKNAESHCNKILPKKTMGDPEYNKCISESLGNNY